MTAHEVITLASVIEMESSKEREIVSSVFHNRLNSDYKYLESCATVLYAMQVRKDILSDVDTKFESPYNTYMHKGLPPGPIASPGDAAIKAALYPADTNYYFFLATGDGKNIFSQTYEEHLEKVRNR